MAIAGTERVFIVHERGAYRFVPAGASAADRGTTYRYTGCSIAEVNDHPGTTVYQTGSYWQLVPRKLYLDADRADYLRASYPLADPRLVGAIHLSSLQAVALFDQHPGLAAGRSYTNHIAQLLLAAASDLLPAAGELVLCFFVEGHMWVVAARDEQPVFFQPRRINSEADAVFNLATLLTHYGFGRAACPVVVGGEMVPDGQLHRQLKIYFHVRELEPELTEVSASKASSALLLAYQRCLRRETLTAVSP